MKKPPTYADFEKQFPDYIIIRKEGCFYETYRKSAKVLSRELEYKLYEDCYGRLTAGGPDCEKIMRILRRRTTAFSSLKTIKSSMVIAEEILLLGFSLWQ